MGPNASAMLDPAVDRALDTLADRTRREVLVGLQQGRIANERDVTDAVDRESAVLVQHAHLPKLAAGEYIEWDRETGDISKGSRFEEVEPFVELLERHAGELPPGRR